MKKLGIAFIFFTLCVIHSSASFAQSNRGFPWDGTITINGDTVQGNITINEDSIIAEAGKFSDSIQGELKGLTLPYFSNTPSKDYLSKDGERYYMEIVPPTMKGKEIDHSDVGLLGGK
jgi:hypothetical protein